MAEDTRECMEKAEEPWEWSALGLVAVGVAAAGGLAALMFFGKWKWLACIAGAIILGALVVFGIYRWVENGAPGLLR